MAHQTSPRRAQPRSGTTATWSSLISARPPPSPTCANPAVEINVVDPLVRKGYRFKGTARVFGEGPDYEAGLVFCRRRGSTSAKPHIVLVKVEHAAELVSPAYDSGQSEAAVIAKWRGYWEKLWDRKA